MKLLASRPLLALGILAGLVALVLLVVDAVRGSRSGLTTTLTVVAAVVAVVLVVAGLVVRDSRRPALRAGAIAAAVVGVVAAVVLVLAVPLPTLAGGVSYDAADGIDLTLTPPDGAAAGDLLLAAVYRRGPGALRVPPGWSSVHTSPLADGTLTLLTRTAASDGDRTPATFAGDAPGTTVGGISVFSHASGAAVTGESGGSGGSIATPPVAGGDAVPALAVVAVSGVTDLQPGGDTTVAWQARVDGAGKGTVALLSRPGGTPGAATVTATAPAPWVAQGVALDAG